LALAALADLAAAVRGATAEVARWYDAADPTDAIATGAVDLHVTKSIKAAVERIGRHEPVWRFSYGAA
jgi:hypothetical protein